MSAFEKPGWTGRDSKAFMAIAGMITGEGFPGVFAQKRKKYYAFFMAIRVHNGTRN